MFRPMIRSKQALDEDAIKEVLDRCTSGVLGLIGDEGYPYTVPISYVYYNDAIYMHCAKKGHKIDAIEANSKASFTVIDADDLVSEEFTTYYRSVIAFGHVEIVKAEMERFNALLHLCNKLAAKQTKAEISKVYKEHTDNTFVLKLNIDHITGKEHQKLAERPANQFIWLDVDAKHLTLAH